MPPNITEFVDIEIHVQGELQAERRDFGRSLILAEFLALTPPPLDRYYGPFKDISEAEAAGFTTATTPDVHAAMGLMFSNGAPTVAVGRVDAGDANVGEALTDIVVQAGSDAFYYIAPLDDDDATATGVNTWVSAASVPYFAVPWSADADITGGIAGNVALALQALSTKRTALVWHFAATGPAQQEYANAAWVGKGASFDLDAPNGAGVWGNRNLIGVTPNDMGSAAFDNVYSAGANTYGKIKGISTMEKGTAAGGRFIDITTSEDWLKDRLEAAAWEWLTGTLPKVPYTNAGLNAGAAVLRGVLDLAVRNGHVSPDTEATPIMVEFVDVAQVPQSDKVARIARYQGICTLAGAIQSVKFTLNLEL